MGATAVNEQSKNLDVAKRLVEALDKQDVDAVADIFAADAGIWHCTDGVTMSVADMQGSLRAIATVAKATVEQTGYRDTPDGFVLTAKSTYDLTNGESTSWHAAMLIQVNAEGRITRLDEYLDSAGTTPLLRALT